jgi:hypothetical protein
MRVRLFAALAFAVLGVAAAAAQEGCYYTPDLVWVCAPRPDLAQPGYYRPYRPAYVRRANCRMRYGRWVCGPRY